MGQRQTLDTLQTKNKSDDNSYNDVRKGHNKDEF